MCMFQSLGLRVLFGTIELDAAQATNTYYGIVMASIPFTVSITHSVYPSMQKSPASAGLFCIDPALANYSMPNPLF